ncbi:MAG: hypothetical protein SFZ03_08335 [Candidatus Melainabacteria bacterium]|nr:hypothetical protein [Candidatus Melainabacteria bacterium]
MMTDPLGWQKILLGACGLYWICFSGLYPLSCYAQGSAAVKPRDIYLTHDRVCHDCTAQWLDAIHVRLSNDQGQSAVYLRREIVGVDTHPFWRKFWRHSYHGMGLPARVIVPEAFDDESALHHRYRHDKPPNHIEWGSN